MDYTVANQPAGCCGAPEVPTLFPAIANAAKGAASYAKYTVSKHKEHVNDAVYQARQQTCSTCTAVDSKGARLLRPGIFKKLTCGEFFMRKPLRDPSKDGCGCLLDAKWRMPESSCPLGKWLAAEKREQIVKHRKRRVPEGFVEIEGVPNVGLEFSIPLTLADGRRILLWVKRIDKVVSADNVVGVKTSSIVSAFGQDFYVTENAEDIQTAISTWVEPTPIEPLTSEQLVKEATNSGLILQRYAWPMAFFSLDDPAYKRSVPTNMRHVRDLPAFLADVKARLLEFKGVPGK